VLDQPQPTIQSVLNDLPSVQRILLGPSTAPSYLTIVQLASIVVEQHKALAQVADWTVGAQKVAALASATDAVLVEEPSAPLDLAAAGSARNGNRAT
jgi:hypothetical protein